LYLKFGLSENKTCVKAVSPY